MASHDPFGLRSLDIEALRTKRGAKWQTFPAEYAAWVADMDYPIAPPITAALQRVLDRDELGYPAWGMPGDLSPAAELFAPRMSDRFGWSPDPSRVHDLVDVIQGVRAVIHHRSEPGDGVVLHLPAYHPYLDSIGEARRRLVPVLPADSADAGHRFDYDALERRLEAEGARIWILCHPHNPLGHVFDRDELQRISAIAERHRLTVLSDEIHADLNMPGHRHVPFASLGEDAAARTVTVTSTSKAFNLAGLRWADLHAGCEITHEELAALPGHYLGAPNLMAVTAAVAAWNDGGPWLDAVVELLDENRRALDDLLTEHLPGAIYRPPAATYLAWVDCRELGVGSDPHRVFRSRGVELSPGPQFGPPGAGHVRINFATSPDILDATVAAMAGH